MLRVILKFSKRILQPPPLYSASIGNCQDLYTRIYIYPFITKNQKENYLLFYYNMLFELSQFSLLVLFRRHCKEIGRVVSQTVHLHNFYMFKL